MGKIIVDISNFICGYPLFFWLMGGGIFLFIRSRAVSLRHVGDAVRSLRIKQTGAGQISSFQALMGAISATVGMGNIAGVAIAIVVGGPGAIFWMWVSAILGMSTKFFEGALAIMYKGRNRDGEVRGGPMYVITEALGKRFRPLAVLFACAGCIGSLSMVQANQMVEAVLTFVPAGNTFWIRLGLGVFITVVVAAVILGGIKSISRVATKIVPAMVTTYFLLVLAAIMLNYQALPEVFVKIFKGAFSLDAGIGGLIGVAITGARRAVFVNEAGVGTAMMMHGASRNNEPVREGFVAMLEPAIDSGLVCTLTAIPIIMADCYHIEGMKGLGVALSSYEILVPYVGKYVLLLLAVVFAFSTMFSYSYYGCLCTEFLFGKRAIRYYEVFYLVMLLVASLVTVDVVISAEDIAFALMSFATLFAVFKLSPGVVAALKAYEKSG